jgi:hypothetical protein
VSDNARALKPNRLWSGRLISSDKTDSIVKIFKTETGFICQAAKQMSPKVVSGVAIGLQRREPQPDRCALGETEQPPYSRTITVDYELPQLLHHHHLSERASFNIYWFMFLVNPIRNQQQPSRITWVTLYKTNKTGFRF